VFFTARKLRVPVVFTNEQHGKLPEDSEVHRFMKDTRPRCTITEEDDADAGFAFGLSGPCGAGGKCQVASHHSGRAEDTVSYIDQMHRAATAAAQAAAATENFRKRSLWITAFCEGMAVPPMTREERVLSGEMRAHPDSHSLLTCR
jgi:hypothetical protein